MRELNSVEIEVVSGGMRTLLLFLLVASGAGLSLVA